MRLITLLILFGAFLTSCEVEKNKHFNYHGITIKNKIQVFYKSDSLFFEILQLSDSSLDGFWTSTSIQGKRGRTELYLGGKLDTSWYYEQDKPVSYDFKSKSDTILYSFHDTTKLFNSIRNKIEAFDNILSPTFEEVKDSSFLNINIIRKYKTYFKNGKLQRELLLNNMKNLDGFWLDHDYSNTSSLRVFANSKLDSTLTISNGQLIDIIQDEGDPQWSYTTEFSKSDSLNMKKYLMNLLKNKTKHNKA